MTAILKAENLKAYYGAVEALHGVDFEVAEGGVTALLGANGAGKTTTLRAISAMIRWEGELAFRGAPLTRRRTEDVARLGVAHAPDGRGTFTDLTVEENLRLGAYTRRDRREARKRLRPHLRLFPAPRRAAAPAGGHAVGRRTADAGDFSRAADAAEPAAASMSPRSAWRRSSSRRSFASSRKSTAAKASACSLSSRTPTWRSISPTTPI